jgi:ArsR family transcriptional regulator
MKIFKCLASDSRLKLLETLLENKLCCKDVLKCTTLDFSTVSRHLHKLADANIIEMQRKGKHIICKVKNPRKVKKLLKLARELEGSK